MFIDVRRNYTVHPITGTTLSVNSHIYGILLYCNGAENFLLPSDVLATATFASVRFAVQTHSLYTSNPVKHGTDGYEQ